MRFVFNDSVIGLNVCTKLESVFPDSFYRKSFNFYSLFLKHILFENNQKAFQPITLMCDHYQ